MKGETAKQRVDELEDKKTQKTRRASSYCYFTVHIVHYCVFCPFPSLPPPTPTLHRCWIGVQSESMFDFGAFCLFVSFLSSVENKSVPVLWLVDDFIKLCLNSADQQSCVRPLVHCIADTPEIPNS